MCETCCPCRSHVTSVDRQVPIHVVYLDRSGSVALAIDGGSSSLPEVDTYEFTPEGCSPSAAKFASTVSMLYRPGHYDILYRTGAAPA